MAPVPDRSTLIHLIQALFTFRDLVVHDELLRDILRSYQANYAVLVFLCGATAQQYQQCHAQYRFSYESLFCLKTVTNTNRLNDWLRQKAHTG